LAADKSGSRIDVAISDFRQVGMRGFYQPAGAVTFDVGVAGVAAAIAHARRLGLADIVINTRDLTFDNPSVVDRYTLAQRVVANAGPLRVAFVARAEHIDFQKIGSVMAQNRGAITDIFATEDEALRWLDTRRTQAVDGSRAAEGPAATSD